MKHDTPTPDKRAAYLQDAEDLRRKADDLEARGLARDALHLRVEAEQVRAEAPPRYTVRHNEHHVLWDILECDSPIGSFYLESHARAAAHASNLYDVAGLNGAADVAAFRRLHVEKLEAQVADLRADLALIRQTLEAQVADIRGVLEDERLQARVDAERFDG